MTSTMDSLDAAFQGGAISPESVAGEALNLAMESQKILKKSVNAILPTMLLLGGLGTIIYRFSSSEGTDPVKAFLIMVVVQLLPMAALKLKTWICAERVSMMPAALVKTIMMHISVQLFRITYHTYCYMYPEYRWMAVVGWQQAFDVSVLVVALYIVIVEFGLKFEGPLAFAKEHSDVLTCILGGCAMAVTVNVVAPPFGVTKIIYTINDFGNYAEILAFVPVARIVCLESGVEEQTQGTNVSQLDRRKAVVFMVFILANYFWDDIIYAISMAEQPMVAAPKAAHFVMLIDFTFYFVLKVGAQPKIVNEILPSILPEAVLQDVLPQEGDAEMGFQGDEQKGLLGPEEDDEDAL